MKRRSFFQAVTAFAATCFLPPIRAARAVQSRVRQLKIPTWLSGRTHWEHLPVPVPLPESYVVYGARDAQIVCRVLGPTHFSFPVAVRCESCNRKLVPSRDNYEDMGGWQVERQEEGWLARCPDHHVPTA